MEVQQKTTTTEVVASILLVATGGITREKLHSDGALTRDQLERYISVLLNSGLLTVQGESLMTTPKGLDYVRMFVHFEYRASG